MGAFRVGSRGGRRPGRGPAARRPVVSVEAGERLQGRRAFVRHHCFSRLGGVRRRCRLPAGANCPPPRLVARAHHAAAMRAVNGIATAIGFFGARLSPAQVDFGAAGFGGRARSNWAIPARAFRRYCSPALPRALPRSPCRPSADGSAPRMAPRYWRARAGMVASCFPLGANMRRGKFTPSMPPITLRGYVHARLCTPAPAARCAAPWFPRGSSGLRRFQRLRLLRALSPLRRLRARCRRVRRD